MASSLFVDSSAWFPIARAGHPDHGRLAAALRKHVAAGDRIVTTNLVLAESHALLLARAGSTAALRFLTEVRSPPNEVVTSDPELEERAISDWLVKYGDQAFSLTDGVSFATMRARGIRNALTLDKHFTVAGFVAISG